LEATRERGYAINRGESRPGVGAVGALVRDGRGAPIAALSVGFPLMTEYERLWEILPPQLIRVAAEVTRRMG
jgi:DNA-binding IclR family transcriptional regulator